MVQSKPIIFPHFDMFGNINEKKKRCDFKFSIILFLFIIKINDVL